MSGSATSKRLATAVEARVDADVIRVSLSDGRELRLRIADHAFLRNADPKDRAECVVDDRGTVLFWPSLSEGISVAGLIGVSEAELEEFAGLR